MDEVFSRLEKKKIKAITEINKMLDVALDRNDDQHTDHPALDNNGTG